MTDLYSVPDAYFWSLYLEESSEPKP